MRHSCKIGCLETNEDKDGYLYLTWKNVYGFATDKYAIEYCPTCGRKAERSQIETENNSTLRTFNNLIKELFMEACEGIFEENFDEYVHAFYEDIIKTTLIYIKSKRE